MTINNLRVPLLKKEEKSTDSKGHVLAAPPPAIPPSRAIAMINQLNSANCRTNSCLMFSMLCALCSGVGMLAGSITCCVGACTGSAVKAIADDIIIGSLATGFCCGHLPLAVRSLLNGSDDCCRPQPRDLEFNYHRLSKWDQVELLALAKQHAIPITKKEKDLPITEITSKIEEAIYAPAMNAMRRKVFLSAAVDKQSRLYEFFRKPNLSDPVNLAPIIFKFAGITAPR